MMADLSATGVVGVTCCSTGIMSAFSSEGQSCAASVLMRMSGFVTILLMCESKACWKCARASCSLTESGVLPGILSVVVLYGVLVCTGLDVVRLAKDSDLSGDPIGWFRCCCSSPGFCSS